MPILLAAAFIAVLIWSLRRVAGTKSLMRELVFGLLAVLSFLGAMGCLGWIAARYT